MPKWNHLVDSQEQPLFDYVMPFANQFESVDIAVAWATLHGVRLFLTSIGNASLGTVVVGINNSITTFEAVLLLLSYGAKVLLYRDSDVFPFHPKAYYFLHKKNNGGRAIVGSSNLTGGGWLNNVELNVLLEDAAAEEVREYILRFATSRFTTAMLNEDDVRRALEGNLLGRERLYRRKDSNASGSSINGRREALSEERKRLLRPISPDVAKRSRELFEQHQEIGFTLYEPTSLDQAVFVINLGDSEANRLKKILIGRKDVGTFELNISLDGLSTNAEFWQWPTNYKRAEKSQNLEYLISVRLRTHLTPSNGVRLDGRLWVRNREGKLSEFRFRFGNASTIRMYFDDSITSTTLFRVERLVQDSYSIEAIREQDTEFSQISSFLEPFENGRQVAYF